MKMQMLFQELDEVEKYDGIWACSSILHLPKNELEAVLKKMIVALKDNGVIYTSFKNSDFEGMRNGRYFTDFTEEKFDEFIKAISEVTVEEYWITDKQNHYMHQYRRVFRFLGYLCHEVDKYLQSQDIASVTDYTIRANDRAEQADVSPLELHFERNFSNVYGMNALKYLSREYGICDEKGNNFFLDYLVNTSNLKDRKTICRSMLTNPFEKFERKRFMYYSKDLSIISMNHALFSQMTSDDWERIKKQMNEDLTNYYKELGGV